MFLNLWTPNRRIIGGYLKTILIHFWMSLELSLVAKCNARFIKKSASQKVIYAQTSFRLGGGGGWGTRILPLDLPLIIMYLWSRTYVWNRLLRDDKYKYWLWNVLGCTIKMTCVAVSNYDKSFLFNRLFIKSITYQSRYPKFAIFLWSCERKKLKEFCG